jgi:hypothetical protein
MEYLPLLDKDPEYDDDTVNVNCVLSWKLRQNALGRYDLQVERGGGWFFDSTQWTGRAGAPRRVLDALLANTGVTASMREMEASEAFNLWRASRSR